MSKTYEIVPGKYNSKEDVKIKVTETVQQQQTRIETIGDIQNRKDQIGDLATEIAYLDEFLAMVDEKEEEIDAVIKKD